LINVIRSTIHLGSIAEAAVLHVCERLSLRGFPRRAQAFASILMRSMVVETVGNEKTPAAASIPMHFARDQVVQNCHTRWKCAIVPVVFDKHWHLWQQRRRTLVLGSGNTF
jgi:hypothetical protein